MNYAVVIPAYNEEEHIERVVAEVQKYTNNIIIVDDGSTDATFQKAENTGAAVLHHRVNMGKGSALKTGCDYAYRTGASHIIVMDSDGQHKPEDIPRFLEALREAEIVYGYRRQSSAMPFVLRFGNDVLNGTLNTLFKTNMKDSQSGYRAFSREAYRHIRWNARDYCMETEMIINARKKRLRHHQIPIETIYNDKYKGTTVMDGIKIVLKILGGKFT